MRRARTADILTARSAASSDAPLWFPLLIFIAGTLVYLNSFSGAFVFDDLRGIVRDPKIQHLLPLGDVLASRRPLVSLSLAINYAISGYEVWSYHAFNLGVHLLAALALYGVVRRSLLRTEFLGGLHLGTLGHDGVVRRSVLRTEFPQDSAARLALVVALIWAVHPLQTESVTYVIQRGESMMGLFYLLTVYCVIRGADTRAGGAWYLAAVVSCALGMASKAVMVTAPLAVLLYDRAILGRSFAEVFRRRWALYVGLAATWGVLALCGVLRGVLTTPAAGASAVGFGVREITPLGYALSQAGVILQYLKLSFWPHPLCLFYWRPATVTPMEVVLPGLVIVALLGATCWALLRKPPLGYVGVWFFLILGPTSSVVPIKDIMFEHRMYLSLAAVAVAAVLAGRWALGRTLDRLACPARARMWLSGALVSLVVGALGYGTVRRNQDYRTEETMWRDVVSKYPDHAPAHYDLALVLSEQGRIEEAIAHLREALRVLPTYAEAHNSLGNALLAQGTIDEAVEHFSAAIQLRADVPEAHSNMGLALYRKGLAAQAVPYFNEALRLDPEYPEAHNYLGVAWLAQGKGVEAIPHLAEAVRLRPQYAEAHSNLGFAYRSVGKPDQAVAQLTESLHLDPKNVVSRVNLGLALADLGKMDEAIDEYRRALAIDPNFAPARENLAAALAARRGP